MANNTSNRGFASMDPEKQRKIASKGGKAAQSSGHAHQLTDTDRSRGGKMSPANFANRSKAEVQEIGRKGGKASGGARRG